MIQQINEQDIPTIIKLVEKHKEKNLYVFLNLNNYFMLGSHKTVYMQQSNGIITTILFRYYNSYQLINLVDLCDFLELSNFLSKEEVIRVSGPKSLIENIQLKNYEISYGCIMKNINTNNLTNNTLFTLLNTEYDLKKCAEFVYTEESIGSSNYVISQLKEQYISRQKYGCKNMVAYDGNMIIGHLATYAETKKDAILGGLLIHKNYRNMGLGKALLTAMANHLIKEGKTPYLYCFGNLEKYYKKLGWVEICKFAKLEKSKQLN